MIPNRLFFTFVVLLPFMGQSQSEIRHDLGVQLGYLGFVEAPDSPVANGFGIDLYYEVSLPKNLFIRSGLSYGMFSYTNKSETKTAHLTAISEANNKFSSVAFAMQPGYAIALGKNALRLGVGMGVILQDVNRKWTITHIEHNNTNSSPSTTRTTRTTFFDGYLGWQAGVTMGYLLPFSSGNDLILRTAFNYGKPYGDYDIHFLSWNAGLGFQFGL